MEAPSEFRLNSSVDRHCYSSTLSKSSRKQRRHDTGGLDVPPGGLTEFPDAEPIELGPHMVLPPVVSVEQVVPEPVVPATTVMPPSMLAPSLWGKGDPPASIMGKWPCPLGKTIAPSVEREHCQIPQCLANCKSNKGCRTHPQATCNNQSHE